MPEKRLRIPVVYDCVVFLQAMLRRESPAGVCLSFAERSIVDLYVSPDVLAEVADVVYRPAIRIGILDGD